MPPMTKLSNVNVNIVFQIFSTENPFFHVFTKTFTKNIFSVAKTTVYSQLSVHPFISLSVRNKTPQQLEIIILHPSLFIILHSFILDFATFKLFILLTKTENILTVDKELNLLELGVTDPIVRPALVLARLLPSHGVKDQLCLV